VIGVILALATGIGLLQVRAGWRAAEARVYRLTRLRQAQSRINGAMIRHADFVRLAETVCRIAVDEGGLDCAIVRQHIAEDDTLVPVAWHAPRTGIIGREVVPLSGHIGISAAAFRESRAIIIGDMSADPLTRHAAEGAARLGVNSAASFPLMRDGRPFATFGLFGPGRHFFDAEIVELLQETADSLTFAHEKLETASAQAESEARYRMLFDSAPEAITVITARGVELSNPAARVMFGYQESERVPLDSVERHLVPERSEQSLARIRAVIHERIAQPPAADVYARLDGTRVEVEAITVPIEFDGRAAAMVIARDLTEQRSRERRIHRLDRLRQARSRINEAMIRASDFAALAREVCRIAVEAGGVKCALVRLHDPARDLLLPLAFHGPETGFIGRQDLPARGDQGVSTLAFQNGRPCVIGDMLGNSVTAHAAAEAIADQVRSAAAFPLMNQGRPFGTLAVFGPGVGYFDAEMTALLEETAGSLAYAHGKLEIEAALAASERDYRTLIEALPLAIGVVCDRRVVLMNRAGLALHGYDSVEAMGDRDVLDFLHPDERQEASRRLATLLADGRPQPPHETVTLRSDGTEVAVEVTSLPFDYHGRPAFLSIIQDITEKRRAERDLRLAQEAGRIGVVIVDNEHRTWSGSPVAFEILGLPFADTRPLSEFYGRLRPGDGASTEGTARGNVDSETRTDTVYRIVGPVDGRTRWVRVATDVERGVGSLPRRIGTVQDVTDTKEAELEALRMSRLYEALSRTNAAIAIENAFDVIAARVCDIIVEGVGMTSTTIRIHDPERDMLVAVARSGQVPPPLDSREIPVNDLQGVAPLAFRGGARVVIEDLSADPATRPFAAAAAALGIGAIAAFPILTPTGVAGTLSLSLAIGTPVDGRNLDLMGELAEALGFAYARHRSEIARRESESRMASIVASAMDAIITCDEGMRIVVFNEAAVRIFGIPAVQAVGMPLERLLPARHRGEHSRYMREFAGGRPTPRSMGTPGRVTGLRADGREFPAEASISWAEAGGSIFYTVIMRDITERLSSERRIGRLSDFYAALSRANETMVRESDWRVLCDEVCRIIVESGKVESAFIRMLSRDEANLVPQSGFGPRTGPDEIGVIPVAADHPTAWAFREKRTAVKHDLLDDPEFVGSRADAIERNVRSAIAVPLVAGRNGIGILSVFATEPEHFDDELQKLMEDLAGDLAFAYGKLEADASIRESEARYRTVVDTSPDAIRIICEGRIMLVNAAYERLFGPVPYGTSFATAVLDRLEPESRRRAEARLHEVIDQRRVAPPDEQIVQLADGTWIPIEATSAPFVLAGKPASITIIRDLSDRKTRERALREAERRFRSLIENSLAGVAVTHGGIFEYVNPGLVAMLGYSSADDLIGRDALDTVLDADRPGVGQAFRSLEGGAGLRHERQRLRMLRADGAVIDVLSSAASIEIDGRILVQAEVRDITRELRARAELEALNRELEDRVAQRTAELTSANRSLEAANRNLESFSYSVAHDLRAPLRNMAGFAGLLELDVADKQFDAIPAHAARIMQNANRMNALIDGLLAVSSVTHSTLADAPVDMAAMVAETVRDTRAGPSVRFEIDPLPTIRGDAAMLRQVWTNLITNAIKYSARIDSPRIHIYASMDNGEYAFHVRDNGAGFDPAYADRLFGVFQRLHTDREFEGTGVGLAIVRRIVERHGGRVWAEGKPGEGATFHFTLPSARLLEHKPG
jgi:PAS domain S-box-containing protein